MSVTQISGLVSGLDTQSLIEAIIASKAGPIRLLEARQAQKTSELAAWQSFEAILLSLKIETERLGDRSLWDGLQVTSSDDTFLTASAETDATIGSWDFFVERLATAHQAQSQAYSSSGDLVGAGTFTISQGTETTDLEVAAGTTLAELADLVNESGADVSATIVRSEAAGIESFHLVLVSDDTGEANRFTVDTSGLTGGTAPDLVTDVTNGEDAVLRLGGETGLALYSSSNTFEDVLQGLDITVHKIHEAGSDERTNIAVNRDDAALESRISGFVESYNAMIGFVNGQYKFDPDVGIRPPLLGSSLLTTLASDLRSKLFTPVAGIGESTFRTLRGIGITTGQDGTLSFNTTDFQAALQEDYDSVANLFRTNASFDAEGLEWITAPAGLDLTDRAIEVEITTPAMQARLEGAEFDPGAGLTIDETNDEFVISLDGRRSETLRLGHGTYTDGASLAAALQSALDGSDDLGALTASVTFEAGAGTAGKLVFTSTKYGAGAKIRLESAGTGSPFGLLGLSGQVDELVTGTDVVGTIGGEEATGKGRILTAAEGTALEGLAFRISADGTFPLTRTATFTEGVGRLVTRRLTQLTDSVDGTLSRITGSVETVIENYRRDIEAKTELLDQRRVGLERKYAQLESLLGRLQSQGNFLSAQVNAMNSTFGR